MKTKRLLAALLAAVMVLCMVPMTALAASSNTKCTLTIVNTDGETVQCNCTVLGGYYHYRDCSYTLPTIDDTQYYYRNADGTQDYKSGDVVLCENIGYCYAHNDHSSDPTLILEKKPEYTVIIGGNAQYETLLSAVNAAQASNYIRLMKDYTVETTKLTEYNLPDGATLDLQGHTLTVPFATALFSGNNITIKNGTITLPTLSTSTNYALFIKSGNVTLENVTVKDSGINIMTGASATIKDSTVEVSSNRKYYAVYVGANASATIESGSFTGGKKNIDVYADTGATVTISGGNFANDVNNSWVADDCEVVDNHIHYSVVKTAEKPTVFAEIGGTQYATLAAAVNAANAGETITLLNDIAIIDVTNFVMKDGVTLDLNGKTIVAKDAKALFSGNNFTIKNGTIKAIGTKDYYVLTVDGGSAVLEGLTVIDGGIKIRNKATVTLKDNDIQANQSKHKYAVWAYGVSKVTIESGTYFGGKNGYDVFAEGRAKLTVNGGTYKFKIIQRNGCSITKNDDGTYSVVAE